MATVSRPCQFIHSRKLKATDDEAEISCTHTEHVGKFVGPGTHIAGGPPVLHARPDLAKQLCKQICFSLHADRRSVLGIVQSTPSDASMDVVAPNPFDLAS